MYLARKSQNWLFSVIRRYNMAGNIPFLIIMVTNYAMYVFCVGFWISFKES